MDMSAAALPPANGIVTAADRQHPRFAQFNEMRAFYRRMMLDCPSFANWLACKQGEEYREEWAAHPEYPAFLAWMRTTRGGGRPTKFGHKVFPENFKAWLEGERW